MGGFLQFRYLFGNYNVVNTSNYGSQVSAPQLKSGDRTGDANGFELRRARINFSGNAFSPDIFFKFEGDFGGTAPVVNNIATVTPGTTTVASSASSSSATSNSYGNFQITDAYIGYRFSDAIKIKAGSFKVPFAKAELTSDTVMDLDERPEVLLPFDPVRAVGLSVFGDLIKDKFNYEVNVNDGAKSNVLGRIADTSGSQDNRLAFYGRVNWAGSGNISDFSEESDLRKDNSEFVWLLGAAIGYESQNTSQNAFPAAQTSLNANGLSTADSPGFISSSAINGDVYRGTVDWSAKYLGWSFNTAGYIQQVNANPGLALNKSSVSTGPYGATDSSFFEAGYYGEVGYFIVPKKFEIVGRVGQLLTEGYSNHMEAYTIGANYYLFGNNAKIQTDFTYVPNEAAYTDAPTDQIANTRELLFRLQLQLKF